jgi:hypothetical protein
MHGNRMPKRVRRIFFFPKKVWIAPLSLVDILVHEPFSAGDSHVFAGLARKQVTALCDRRNGVKNAYAQIFHQYCSTGVRDCYNTGFSPFPGSFIFVG